MSIESLDEPESSLPETVEPVEDETELVDEPPKLPPVIQQLGQNIKKYYHQVMHDEAIVTRFSAHFAVICVTIFAIVFNNIRFPESRLQPLQPFELVVAAAEPANNPPPISESLSNSKPFELPKQLDTNNRGVFFRAAAPLLALVTPPRQEISQYMVQAGDTIYGIAYQFGLSPETVLWSNPELENNPHLLQVGQTLNILPFDGIYHQVGGGDTLDNIASTYKVTPDVIINSPLNSIDPLNPVIEVGQWVVVPGGSKPFIPPKIQSVVNYSTSNAPPGAPVGSGFMAWPVTGRISQGYYGYHPALDIESPIGTPVLAVDAGFVAAAGWDGSGYGWNVVVDHGNGLQSMYAHLQSYSVNAGDIVQKGQAIGEIGMSGRSSGPHLHLEIRQGTIQLNPANYLP